MDNAVQEATSPSAAGTRNRRTELLAPGHLGLIMDIAGIGTDIVEVVRIAQMIEKHGEIFLHRVFTAHEIRYCQGRKHATEHYAGRWAAKEAILKCLGTGWSKGISWTDMEVRNEYSGAPRVTLSGAAGDRAAELGITDIWLTISHCRAYATAYALAVKNTMSRPRADDDPLA